MKKIAVVTGASSGMGRVFAETINQSGADLDEVWVIARRADKLQDLQCPYKIRPLPLDLSDRANLGIYAEMLQGAAFHNSQIPKAHDDIQIAADQDLSECSDTACGIHYNKEEIDVKILINASGYGKLDGFIETPTEVNLNMVDLNCQALQAMCQITIPYMRKGAHIVNIASIAAFQPVPYAAIYAATKSFVLSFSRSLNRELRSRGIHVMALCPYWTRTGFFDRAVDSSKAPVVKKYIVMYEPEKVVARAWKDMKRGRDVCTYGAISKGQAAICKILPHSLIMSIWMRQQDM